MLGRLISALSAVLIATSSVFAAGTLPGISMSQQLDEFAKPLSGGKLFLIQAGTTSTPQNCFQDSGLTLPLPNPITLDSAGRIPQLFCADGSIKIRLTDKNGSQKLVQDNLLIVGPSGGGGGGGTVDPTTIFQTGAFMQFYGTGNLPGWVRCNGKTIGSVSSGASERANADTQSLFQYFWSVDTNLAVSGGRGASANADWAANKTLTLPDCRGRVLAGLGDMGNSAASWLTSTYFGASPTVLGAVSTTTDHVTLTTPNLPPYTPSGSVSVNSTVTDVVRGVINQFSNGNGVSFQAFVNGNVVNQQITSTGSLTGTAQGGTSTPFAIVQPTILVTSYLKL